MRIATSNHGGPYSDEREHGTHGNAERTQCFFGYYLLHYSLTTKAPACWRGFQPFQMFQSFKTFITTDSPRKHERHVGGKIRISQSEVRNFLRALRGFHRVLRGAPRFSQRSPLLNRARTLAANWCHPQGASALSCRASNFRAPEYRLRYA